MIRFRSVKGKITCWYAVIIILIFGAALIGTLIASEYYGEDKVRKELEDEISDLREDILRYPEYFPKEELTSYYDDGVMLSIYDEKGRFINGVLPDGFPDNIPFSENKIQEVRQNDDDWFLSDRNIQMADGSRIWIRGIHSFSSITFMLQRLSLLLFILCPVLILAALLIGYRMVQRSLHPVQVITQAAETISHSGKLSTRLERPEVKDEFYHLTEAFNDMFDKLEKMFVQEREFSSNAAHELRTPISIIISHCEYCLEDLTLSEEARQEMELIRQKAVQISELISQLLSITRAESRTLKPHFEDIDLSMLLQSVVEELEEKAKKKKISFHIINNLKDPVIEADMSMLTRLCINLLSNAVLYGKRHGSVWVRMEEVQEQIILEFEDDGIGIPADSINRIWDRFYQVDFSRSQSEGFGLGLPMVKQIVEYHKGSIQVSSILAQGTTFTVKLPRKQGL